MTDRSLSGFPPGAPENPAFSRRGFLRVAAAPAAAVRVLVAAQDTPVWLDALTLPGAP